MLKSYLKITLNALNRKKLYSALSIFIISFTLMIVMTLTSIIEQFRTNSYPEPQIDKLLVTSFIEVQRAENNGGWSGQISHFFMDKYFGAMKTPKHIGTTSLLNEQIDIYNGTARRTINARYTDPGFWNVMHFNFIEGKPFRMTEFNNQEKIAIISEKLAREFFEGKAVGKTIKMRHENYKVYGVVENVNRDRLFSYADVWFPVSLKEKNKNTVVKSHSGCFDGISLGLFLVDNKTDKKTIINEFNTILPKIEKEDNVGEFKIWLEPSWYVFLSNFGMNSKHARFIIPGLLSILFLAFVIIPSSNLYSLQKARYYERGVEIGVRKAFGAHRWVLKKQFLIENVIITGIGGIIGFLMSLVLLAILNNTSILNDFHFRFSFQSIMICMTLIVVFGLISGRTTAKKLSKQSIIDSLNLHK